MYAALVTGAGTRLGRAMALMLAERGYDVAIHYLNSRKDAESAAAEARKLGVRACILRADLLSEGDVASLVPRAGEALGRTLTLLVNNASIFEPASFQNATRERWDRHMESNLRAPFRLMQEFAAQVPAATIEQSGETGSSALVVNMVDQCVVRPTLGFTVYSIAKMGLWALTQAAAIELAPVIRVNAIAPGPTLPAARQSATHFLKQRQATPLKRGPHPCEITAALVYLIDSPSVTGQIMFVDGGLHLGVDATSL